MGSEGSECPPNETRTLPETITAGGVTRWLTRHLREDPDDGVTANRIQHVLENWVVRGICTDNNGSVTVTHWGFVPGRNAMLRVPVSLDNDEIISAHFDGSAARRVRQQGLPWFQRHCQDVEVRSAS